jgi:hypothetical protein
MYNNIVEQKIFRIIREKGTRLCTVKGEED